MAAKAWRDGDGFSFSKELYVNNSTSPASLCREPTDRLQKITGVIGILALIFLVDFPDRAHKSFAFLSEKECAFIVRRINRDRSDGDVEPFTLKRFLRPALDAKIWGFALIFL